MASSLGRDIHDVLEDIAWIDLQAATSAMRESNGDHPFNANCDCPLIEALAVLYERGYRLELVAAHGG